jgi:hypothetical protein
VLTASGMMFFEHLAQLGEFHRIAHRARPDFSSAQTEKAAEAAGCLVEDQGC